MELVAAERNETSPGKASALPSPWIDRLFGRFALMYGKHWADLWAGLPGEADEVMAAVKRAWADDLAGCNGEQIRRALEHCKANNKFPPTCPEFVSLCRQFRVEPAQQTYLPAPRGELPPQTAAILDQLQPTPGRDTRQWARDILQRHSEGIVYPYISLQFAREALGAE